MKTLIGTLGAMGPTSPSFRVRTRIPSAELCRFRTRLGDAGRQRVEQDFSVEVWAPRLAAALSGEDHVLKADAPSYGGAEAPAPSRSK